MFCLSKREADTCKENGTALLRFVIVCQMCVPKTPYLKVVGIIIFKNQVGLARASCKHL